MKTSKIGFTLLVKNKVDTSTRCFQNFNTTPNSQDTVPIILLRGNFNNFRPETAENAIKHIIGHCHGNRCQKD